MNSDLLRQSSCRYSSLTFSSVSGWSHRANLYLSFGTEIVQHPFLWGNPGIFGVKQPFVGITTPFFLKYEFSNPFSFSALESRKSPTRPALPGAVSCAGVQQQPRHFLPLDFRPCPNPPQIPQNQHLSKPARQRPNMACPGPVSSVFSTQPPKADTASCAGLATHNLVHRDGPTAADYQIFLPGGSLPSSNSKQHSV